MAERNYYMVRAMLSREEDFHTFFGGNVAAVGWSDVDFTAYPDGEALREAAYRAYYQDSGKAPQHISKKLNEVVRFKEIQKGDYILVPFNSYVALAEAGEEEIYSQRDRELDLANQRRVAYHYENGKILALPRAALSEGLQRRLRVRGNTVSSLFEFKEEIERIFARESYSYSQEMQNMEQQELAKLKSGLLKHIQSGRTNLQTGGVGLEHLVCELMRCEGYESEVLAKNKFTGRADADIRAIKEDSFMSKRIFVQVKHHSGYSGEEGVRQIIGVLAQKDYEGYDGYFITSALVPDSVRKLAAENDIEVMDGNALVDLIVNNLDKLSEATKRQLGLCTIPRIIS